METFNLGGCTKKIYDSGLKVFSLKTLKDLLEIEKESTLFSIINRLIKLRVLAKIEKNKYLLQAGNIHDFTLANFLYQPSYVSFETALNFYGILSQFPYEVTSATLKKTGQKTFADKLFSYTHLKKKLFWGYEKRGEFLIAVPEKALLDQIYLSSKGLRRINWEEYDFSALNINKFKNYLAKFPLNRQFKKTLNLLRQNLKI